MPDNDHFGPEIAAHYDRDHGGDDLETVAATVAFLSRFADEGPVLEFAVGTGRIALPLAAQGIEVHGIELSPAMVAELRTKSGGETLPVTIGDMATTHVDGAFCLVYLVFNTISNLTSQDAQVACFENAAAHLRPGGHFVVENAVPPLQRLAPGTTQLAFDCSGGHSGIDEINVATQDCVSHHVWFEDGAVRRLSLPFRYVWPSELDLMARIAGLTLVERWQGWTGTPFTGRSESHVSVWRKLPA